MGRLAQPTKGEGNTACTEAETSNFLSSLKNESKLTIPVTQMPVLVCVTPKLKISYQHYKDCALNPRGTCTFMPLGKDSSDWLRDSTDQQGS